MSRYRSACLLALILTSAVVFAATSAHADCASDLAAVDKSFTETLARLDAAAKGTQAEKCAAYRSHVAIMTNGYNVFMRCMSGHAQRENAGQMGVSIDDFNEIITRRCKQ